MLHALDDAREQLAQIADPMALLVGMFVNAPVGLQLYSPGGRSLLTNRAFRAIFGTEPPPEYNLFDDPLLVGTDVLVAARRAFAGEVVELPPTWYDTHKQPLARGGRRCAVACTWLPLFDAGGRVSHVVLIFRDVTAELGAKEEIAGERDRLRETQNRLQALLDNAPAIIFVKDLDGRHVVVNLEATRTFGFDGDRAAGKTARELFGPALGARLEANEAKVLEERRPSQVVETLPTRDGERQFLVSRFAIAGAGAEPIAVGGIAVDISERLHAQALLQRSEARFKQMFRSLPMAALLSRLSDRRFMDVNDAWLRLTGYSREESIGATSLELSLWRDLPRRTELFQALGEHGSVRDFPARMRVRSGALREVMLSADRTELGGEACLLLIAHDVTDQRQLERELRQAQKMEAVGRLAGGVAHDFNNILTAMNGADALLLEGLPPDSPLRRYAEQIKRSIGRATTLTRQLLTFTHKQPVQPVILDPNAAVRAVVDMLRRMIGADIELVTTLEARGRVETDVGAFEQVLLNLAVNARDAMPGGGTLSLRTADVERAPGVPDGRWVLVGVADSGIGMDAATRARAFEPFFTTKEQGKGTGLGLSTVYGIVTQAGGHILVDSEPGRGADFRIYLPRVDARPSVEAPAAAEAVAGGSETVLLVEDDEAVRDFVELVLKRLGYRVLIAGDGLEALGVAAGFAGPIDLLLSDVVMPHMNGRELARRLAPSRPAMKVIHMSGYLGDAAEPAPRDDVRSVMLAKPFQREELARAVRQTLDGTFAE
ncbi:MAG TPA: PAS domain S-box protein [Polyangia bacterium]|jgi:PAS domain S-box-containing protein